MLHVQAPSAIAKHIQGTVLQVDRCHTYRWLIHGAGLSGVVKVGSYTVVQAKASGSAAAAAVAALG